MRKLTSRNFENEQQLAANCPMQFALQLISGRWKLLLLWYVHSGVVRFSGFKQTIPAITTKMLSQQLRELEASGLLTRTIYPEMPPRVEYALTDTGHSLIPVLTQLNSWGVEQQLVASSVQGAVRDHHPDQAVR
jgi:DNA-binding HxlR family transcriptional regulator